jgi:hypothetical protein
VLPEQKARGTIRAAKTPRRFAETCRRKVQKTESLEERRIVHRRIERGHELFGDVEFSERGQLVRPQRRVPLGPRRCALEHVDEAQDPQQRQWKAGREQRIDHAGCRRQKRPIRSRRFRAAKGEPRRVHHRQHGPRRAELIGDRRQRGQQPVPRSCRVAGAQRRRGRIGQGRSRARYAVVEPQDPYPTAGKYVMYRRIVNGIGRPFRRRANAVPAFDIGEVRIDALRRRQPALRHLAESEEAVEETTRSAGINHELRGDTNGTAFAVALERRATARGAHGRQLRAIEIQRALSLRFLHERVVEVRAIPVHVRDLVMRTRSNHQLSLAIVILPECPARLMEEEREPTLQPARHIGPHSLPGAPLRERPDPRQVVAIGEFLDEEIGERRGRLPDGEARVAAAFGEDDAPSTLEER